MEKQAKKISILAITLVASLGGFLFGFDLAVISGVVPLLVKQFALSDVEQGWFVSSALVGCIIGVAFSGELTDKIGRKKPLLISAILFLLSAVGCALAPSMFWLIAARLLGGIGIGLASNVVPLYISEIAPAKSRGRLITYYQFALTLGILIATLSNAALLGYAIRNPLVEDDGFISIMLSSEIWRAMLGIGAIPAVLFLVGLFSVPESPRWLIQHGRAAEGKSVLAALGMASEANAIPATEEKASYKELFSPRWRRALLIGILLPLFSQFSGINAIFYYGPTILSDAGVSLENSLTSQVFFGAANMLFTLIAIWKVDSLGRRPLYIVGTIGAALSLLATGIMFNAGATTSIWLLIFVLMFLAFFAFSIGPLKFVVAAEIFPSKIRGRAMAISIMVMWIADTIVGQLTPVLLKSIGTAGTFWIFSGFCAIAFFTVYKLLPETKGKSLEEIEGDWKGKGKNTADNTESGEDTLLAKFH